MTKLLTTAEAAARLGVTQRRVVAMILAPRSKLPASRFGPVWLIKESDLKKVANRKSGRPTAKAAGHSARAKR